MATCETLLGDVGGITEPLATTVKRRLSRLRARLFAASAIGALLVSACSSDDSDSSDTTATVSDAPAASTEPPATQAAATTQVPETTTPATTAAPTTAPPAPVDDLTFSVNGIVEGEAFPAELVCDQGNVPPVVTIDSVPDGTAQLALIVDDPDAPTAEPFSHWIVYAIPGDTTEFTDAEPTLEYGTNDAGTTEWFGPCPPPADDAHTYVFELFALAEPIDLEPGLDARAVREAVEPAAVATAEVTATHDR